MKSRIAAVMIILAAIALVVGWIWPVHAQQSNAVRWEYCVVGPEAGRRSATDVLTLTTQVYYYTPQGVRTDTIETNASSQELAIAKLGMDGWEMVQVTQNRVYFKRQVH